MLAAILFSRSSLAPPPGAEAGRARSIAGKRRLTVPVANAKGRPAMSDRLQRRPTGPRDMLEPVHMTKARAAAGFWTQNLVVFLRIMATVSLVKGLYHWAAVCGLGAVGEGSFETHTLAWQAATVFFAVIDLVAAVGLWLVAPWGAVVWLTAVVSMAAVEVFFPQIYGGSTYIAAVGMGLLGVYLLLAILAARERPA